MIFFSAFVIISSFFFSFFLFFFLSFFLSFFLFFFLSFSLDFLSFFLSFYLPSPLNTGFQPTPRRMKTKKSEALHLLADIEVEGPAVAPGQEVHYSSQLLAKEKVKSQVQRASVTCLTIHHFNGCPMFIVWRMMISDLIRSTLISFCIHYLGVVDERDRFSTMDRSDLDSLPKNVVQKSLRELITF